MANFYLKFGFRLIITLNSCMWVAKGDFLPHLLVITFFLAEPISNHIARLFLGDYIAQLMGYNLASSRYPNGR